MLSHPPVQISDFAAHVARLKANDAALFAAEYESIDPGGQFTWEASNLELNKPKNRYANVIAYDHSRVRLQTLDGLAPASDYINANYLDGYCRANAYIATQVCVLLYNSSVTSILSSVFHFYQRVSIASYANRWYSQRRNVRLSVRLSVCHTPVLYQNEES